MDATVVQRQSPPPYDSLLSGWRRHSTAERRSTSPRSRTSSRRRPSRHPPGATATAAPASRCFPWPGAARNVYEKLDDAAYIHRLTGAAPTVALHIPWDRVADWPGLLGQYAAERVESASGRSIPTCSRTRSTSWEASAIRQAEVRERAVTHMIDCCADHGRHRQRSCSACGWQTAPTMPARTAWASRKVRLEDALAEVYSCLPASGAHAAGVQVLRAGVLSHRSGRLGHRLRHRPQAGTAARRCWWIPGTMRCPPTSPTS